MEKVICSLHQLLAPWAPKITQESLVHAITSCSQQVTPGSLFFALPGIVTDGMHYVQEAVTRGATAVVTDASCNETFVAREIPLIKIPQLSSKLSDIASRFYHRPSQSMEVIGITGTNGKTTVGQLIAEWSQLLGIRSGSIGTLGIANAAGIPMKFPSSPMNAPSTTPEAITLQAILYCFLQQDVQRVTLEVSSHGIAQHRASGCQFALGICTNITPEHLDYHGSFSEYASTKLSFLSSPSVKRAIGSVDDPAIANLLYCLPDATLVSLRSNPAPCLATQQWMYATNTQYGSSGIVVEVDSSWGKGRLQTSAMAQLGHPWEEIVASTPSLNPVSGRLEKWQAPGKPTVFVDYAHTPDALEKALQAIRTLRPQRLICVFGCAGQRDATKRPIMGKIAEAYADTVILTDDNPRNEDPQQIFEHVLVGMKRPERVVPIHNRAAAVRYAYHLCSPQDCLLIAGKGHETTQVYQREFPYSDQRTVQSLMEIV